MVKIAIVDDDIDIIDAVSLILKNKGIEVVSATNTKDGFELIERERPDLVLLDVMMEEPDDGFFLAMKLRNMGFEKPILLLTSIAKVSGYDFGVSENLPVDEFLEKPIKSDVLLDIINKYLGKK